MVNVLRDLNIFGYNCVNKGGVFYEIFLLKIKFPNWYDDPDGGDTFWLGK